MAKSKAKKKKASKPVAVKTAKKRNTRMVVAPTASLPRTDRRPLAQNGAAHANGSARPPAANGAEGAVDQKVLDAGTIKTKSGVDLTEKVRELLILAKEQGHLTYDDINDALPDNIVNAGRSRPDLHEAGEPGS